MILKQDGSMWATGLNFFGQLGLGDGSKGNNENNFKVILPGVKAVAAGAGHSVVIKKDGSVWTVGMNNFGQLGDGSIIDKQIFVRVVSTGAKAVSAGGKHTLMVKRNGSVWATGYNMYGQLGQQQLGGTHRTIFFKVIKSGGETVAGGFRHSMLLKQDGSVWATGMNDEGQLGDGSTESKHKFVQVIASGATAIAAGCHHSLALMQDGSVWGTGGNTFGQLGDGSTTSKTFMRKVTSPVMEKGIGGAVAIAAGMTHSLVLGQDGSVWASGKNNYGQLGDGTTVSKNIFVKVISSGVQTVAAGAWHNMFMTENGNVWATGANDYGQLGDGSQINKNTFARVVPPSSEPLKTTSQLTVDSASTTKATEIVGTRNDLVIAGTWLACCNIIEFSLCLLFHAHTRARAHTHTHTHHIFARNHRYTQRATHIILFISFLPII